MPDIKFNFPNLDINPEEDSAQNDAAESTDTHTQEQFPAESAYSEQLFSGIMDSRYVSLDNDNIDISQFPALRNALGLSESHGIESASSDGADSFQQYEEESAKSALPEIPEEEPIPSIFAGIGRSDWSGFELDLLAGRSASESDDLPEDNPLLGCEEIIEFAEEELIDTDYLLDFIDDIEFSGMEAEPLGPIKIKQTSSDPYNTAFNAYNPNDDEDLNEFEMESKFIFEEN